MKIFPEERKIFEKWAKANGHRNTMDRNIYLRLQPYECPETRAAWSAWKAAIKSARRRMEGNKK